MAPIDELEQLRNKIIQLEEKLEQLRISRRVLMNLVGRLQAEKLQQIQQMERLNLRLQKNNSKYARALWKARVELFTLRSKASIQMD